MLSERPLFRADLKISTRRTQEAGDRHIVIRPEDGKMFEFGPQDFFLCRHFNGRLSFEEIRRRFEAEFNMALDPEMLAAFARLLAENKLFVADAAPKKRLTDLESWLIPAPTRVIRFGNPQPLLETLLKWFGGCFTRSFAFGAVGFFVLLGCILNSKFSLLFEQAALLWNVRPFSNVVLCLGVAIFLLNVPHEIAHGMAVVRFGGRVKECGVRLWLNFFPIFYCDTKDTVWLRKKSQRVAVFAAGLYWELLATEAGLIGWRLTLGSPALNQFYLALATFGGFAFLFNFIPLLNRDGYFVMIQWLETPNLRWRAFSAVSAWLRLGPSPEPLTGKERLGFAIYTLLAAPYTYVPFGAWILSRQMIDGYGATGALLVLSGTMLLFQKPMEKQLNRLAPVRWYQGQRFGKIRRRLIRIALILCLLLLMLIPYPYETGGSFRLVPYQQAEMRAQVKGEVMEVFVSEGQKIRAGEKLATLNRRVYEKELKTTQEQLEHQKALLRIAQEGAKPEQLDKARQAIKSARVRLDYSTREAKRMEKLFGQKVISEQAWDDARRQQDLDAEKLEQAEAELKLLESGARSDTIESIEAEVRRLEVEVAHTQENLDLTTLKSPIDGQVTSAYLNERIGHLLKEGDVFAVIQDQRTIQAEVEVPESDIGEVRIGSPVRVRMWAYPTMTFPGEVASIAPVAIGKAESRFVRVLTNLPNSDGLLKPEMTGYAKIESETRPLGMVLTRTIIRFFLVQVWYWIP